MIMLALVNNEPKVLSLQELLEVLSEASGGCGHQKDEIRPEQGRGAGTHFERACSLRWIISTRSSRSSEAPVHAQVAKEGLMERFGLDDVQAQAIVDMRLRALTGLEREKLEQEYAELMKQHRGVESHSGR